MMNYKRARRVAESMVDSAWRQLKHHGYDGAALDEHIKTCRLIQRQGHHKMMWSFARADLRNAAKDAAWEAEHADREAARLARLAVWEAERAS